MNSFSEILNTRAYLRNIAINTNSKPTINEISKDTIEYLNTTLNISKLEFFFKELINRCSNLLYNNLLDISKDDLLYKLNPDSIKDDIFNKSIRFYFKNNTNLSSWDDFLLKRLFNSNSFSKKFIKNIGPNGPVFRLSEVEKWLENRNTIINIFLVLFYSISGSPPRSEEILQIKYRNTLETQLRNIYIDNISNLIQINLNYHKGVSISRKNKENIRFLPQALGDLIKIYLLLIQPFYIYLKLHVLNKDISNIDYFFKKNNKKLTTKDLIDNLILYSIELLDNSIRPTEWRHLCRYIIKNRILETGEDLSDSENEIEDLQSNSSTKIYNSRYARNFTTFSNKDMDIYNKSKSLSLKYFKYFNLLNPEYENSDSKLLKLNIKNPSKKHSRQVSDININQISKKAKGNLMDRSLYQEFDIEERDLIINSINLNDGLKRFFKDNSATFRSIEQKEAIEAIFNKIPRVIYISATGSGKSLLFLLPTFLKSEETTIAIIPFIVLKDDLYKTAIDSNISIEIFEDSTNNNASLQLISIENIDSDKFIEFIKKNSYKKTIRLVIDEAHIIITQASFRWITKYVKTINKYKIQIVIITATLSREIQTLLFKELNIDANNRFIKASTERNNISYNIIGIPKEKNEIDSLKEFINNKIQPNILPGEKAIIFTNSYINVDKIAKKLDYLSYDSRYTPEKKKEIFKNWINKPENYFIVSSTALSYGIDYKAIQYIIYIYKKQNFIDFLQEVGRAGRDNKDSYSYFFIKSDSYKLGDKNPPNFKNNIESFRDIDKFYLLQYINKKICRRRIINYYLQDKFQEECNIHQNKYDLCLERHNIYTNKAKKQIEFEDSNKKEKIYFEKKLNILDNRCAICFWTSEYLTSLDHKTEDCINISNKNFNENIGRFTKKIERESLLKIGTACFNCLLPQNICLSKLNDEGCQYPRLIIPWIIALYQNFLNKKFQHRIFTDLDTRKFTIEDLAIIISKPSIIFNTDCIQAINILSDFNYNDFINSLEFNNDIEAIDYTAINYTEDIDDSEDINFQNIESDLIKEASIESIEESIIEELANIDISQPDKSEKNQENIENDEFFDDNNLDIGSSIIFMQENEKKIVDNIKKQEENENDEFFDDNTLDIESSLLYIEENEKRILKNKEINDFVEEFIDKLDFLEDRCIFCYFNEKDYKNHGITACLEYEDIFKQSYAKYKDGNRIYNQIIKEEAKKNFQGKISKTDQICSQCLLPITVCFKGRNIYSNSIKKCIFYTGTWPVYFAIFKYRKSRLFPFYLYNKEYENSDSLGFENYISNMDNSRYYKGSKGWIILIEFIEKESGFFE